MSNDIGRREFLGGVGIMGAAAVAAKTTLIDSAQAATPASEITSASASELAEAIRSKKLSSKAIVEAHLDRIRKLEALLKKVRRLGFGQAIEVGAVEYYRIEAEYWLAHAQAEAQVQAQAR